MIPRPYAGSEVDLTLARVCGAEADLDARYLYHHSHSLEASVYTAYQAIHILDEFVAETVGFGPDSGVGYIFET